MVSIKAILVGLASALGSARAVSPNWVSLSTEASQVSYDGNMLCLSNDGSGILCSTQEFEGHPIWDYHSGQVSGARVWGDMIWAVGLNGEVMYTSSKTQDDWHTVPGRLKSLSTDGKQVCGISYENEIVCADDELTTNPSWRKLPGKFRQLDLTDGVIWAVSDYDYRVYYGFSNGEADWKMIPASFQQVSYDGGVLCGITPENQLLCPTTGLPSTPAWQLYDGQFTYVEVQAGRVYAVEMSTMVYVYYLAKPPLDVMGQEWLALKSEPQLRQINFDGKTLVGTAADMGVWVAIDNFDFAPSWFKIDGLLTHVVVWGDRIYGVNVERMLWTAYPNINPQWKRLDGEFTQVSTDGKQLCAVNPNTEIWCADTHIDSMPNWRRVDSGFQHIVVLNGVLMASRVGDDSVWVGYSQGAPKWRRMDGVNLRKFEYDGTNLCGTDSSGNIVLIDSGFVEGTPNTKALAGKAAYTTINGDRVFAITQDYKLYLRKNM